VAPTEGAIRLLAQSVATQGFQPHDGDYEGIDRILRGEATHSDGGTLDRPSLGCCLSAIDRRAPTNLDDDLPTCKSSINYPVRVWIS
jgi:hypothetical protein